MAGVTICRHKLKKYIQVPSDYGIGVHTPAVGTYININGRVMYKYVKKRFNEL